MENNTNPFSSDYKPIKTKEELIIEQQQLLCTKIKEENRIKNSLKIEQYKQLLLTLEKTENNINKLIYLYNYNDLRTKSNDYWRLFNKIFNT